MTPLPSPSPLWVPSGVCCTALTLTCTTLGPTFEATCATGSSAGIREGVCVEVCDNALAVLFSCEPDSFWEHPASSSVASSVASQTERAVGLEVKAYQNLL